MHHGNDDLRSLSASNITKCHWLWDAVPAGRARLNDLACYPDQPNLIWFTAVGWTTFYHLVTRKDRDWIYGERTHSWMFVKIAREIFKELSIRVKFYVCFLFLTNFITRKNILYRCCRTVKKLETRYIIWIKYLTRVKTVQLYCNKSTKIL